MTLQIIPDDDDEPVKKGDKEYIKFRMKTQLKQLNLELKKEHYHKMFYGKFKDIVDEFVQSLGVALENMSPSERDRKIDILPPIPTFLDGPASYNLQVNKEQHEDISSLAKLLNTPAGNLAKIMYYLSLPENLYSEFPFLLKHYQQVEITLNWYLEEINPEKKFTYYEHLKNLI